jgi:hypothetical protein
MQFKHWVNENVFRYDPQGNIKPELLLQLAAIRRDPRFAQYGDDQIEMMLLHHTVKEVLAYGPEKSLERYNDLSILDGLLGDT